MVMKLMNVMKNLNVRMSSRVILLTIRWKSGIVQKIINESINYWSRISIMIDRTCRFSWFRCNHTAKALYNINYIPCIACLCWTNCWTEKTFKNWGRWKVDFWWNRRWSCQAKSHWSQCQFAWDLWQLCQKCKSDS